MTIDVLKILFDETGSHCKYCKKEMFLSEYSTDMITIERIDDSIGHVINNVIFACLECNVKRMSLSEKEILLV
jgi:hypothetical protein